MKNKVRVLSDAIINKIAAGEVVERPASVVKELVENSLDAGATEITVEMSGGGRRSLRILDNGCGMSREDVTTALRRHATSKLTNADDLFDIHTLGFRGEALAAIGGVSRLEITTRLATDDVGTRIRADGGSVEGIEEAGCPVGTEISVQDLFFNTPARLKFLRSATVEGGHIVDVVTRLALASDDVGFLLRRGKDNLLRVSKVSSGRERVFEVLGHRVGDHMYPVEGERMGCSLRGFISSPALSRSGWTGFYVFVNGRSLRDRTIMRSVAEAYRGILPRGRYPMVVLHLQVPPGEVDVNVHPGKLEVRFARGRLISQLVVDTLRRALTQAPWKKRPGAKPFKLTSPTEPRREPAIPQAVQPAESEAPASYPLPEQAAIRWQMVREVPQSDDPWGGRPEAPPIEESSPGLIPSGAASMPEEASGGGPAAVLKAEEGAETSPDETESPASLEATASRAGVAPGEALTLIGEYGGSYLLCEAEGDLVFVDQKRVREAVCLAALLRGPGKRVVQPFLVPQVVELDRKEGQRLLPILGLLRRAGVEVEPFGGNSFAVKAVPSVLVSVSPTAMLQEVVREVGGQIEAGQESARFDSLVGALSRQGAASSDGTSAEAILKSLAKLSADEPGRDPAKRLMKRLTLREVRSIVGGR